MKRTLVLLANDPSAWQLQSTIAWYVEGSSELYESFLRDLLALMGQLNETELIIRYAPERARRFFSELAPTFAVLPQRGLSERERLVNALGDHVRAQSGTVLVWTHTPHLPASRLRDAFSYLEDGADVVVGPCEDGNIYLFGSRVERPDLLADMPSKPAQRMHFIHSRAQQSGLRVKYLPPWYAVSTHGDLRRLAEDLQTMPEWVSPHTRKILGEIGYQARAVGE
jgi:uncharacterized protein